MGLALCRSELAREKPIGAAFIQEARVIVDVFREQARSYRVSGGLRFQPGGVATRAHGFAQPFMGWVFVEAWVPGLRQDQGWQ